MPTGASHYKISFLAEFMKLHYKTVFNFKWIFSADKSKGFLVSSVNAVCLFVWYTCNHTANTNALQLWWHSGHTSEVIPSCGLWFCGCYRRPYVCRLFWSYVFRRFTGSNRLCIQASFSHCPSYRHFPSRLIVLSIKHYSPGRYCWWDLGAYSRCEYLQQCTVRLGKCRNRKENSG